MSSWQSKSRRFSLRLAATLVVTMSLVGASQYVLSGRALTNRVLDHDLAGHQADAEVLTSLHRAGTADPLSEVRSLLGHMAARPALTSVVLLDEQGEVVLRGMKHRADMQMPAEHAPAMDMPADAPAMDMPADAPAMDVPADAPAMDMPADAPAMDMSAEPLPAADLRIARAVMGASSARAERIRSADRVVHAVPVQLGAERYALVVARSDAPLDAQVQSVREVLLLTLALGTALALPLFFLIGGRGLAVRHRRALDASLKDGLTGLGNHRHFHERMAATVAENTPTGAPLCLALVDLDGFKQVNDVEGHRRGDEVLARVGRVLLAAAPGNAYRVGGDEFALVLPGRIEEANTLAEQVRHQIGALSLGVTTSIGVAPLVPGSTLQPLWDAADAALYEAKRGGRNRVVLDGSASVFAAR